MTKYECGLTEGFQPTLPVWGATRTIPWAHGLTRFQPTLPVWGATEITPAKAGFQPMLPVWGATTGVRMGNFHADISTHAPRMGSDPEACTWFSAM